LGEQQESSRRVRSRRKRSHRGERGEKPGEVIKLE